MKEKIIPFFIPHYGCNCRCIFCDQGEITGVNRPPLPNSLREMVLRWISHADGERFTLAFYGGSFTGLPREILKAYLSQGRALIDEGLIHSMRCSTRPETINSNVVEEISLGGMTTVELGVQSLNNEVLRLCGRQYDVQTVRNSVSLLKKRGLQVGLQQMVGLPGSEPMEESRDTAKRMISMDPDFVRIYPTVVLPGTELYQMMLAGKYTPLELVEAVNISAEILSLYEEAGIPVIRIGLQASENLDNNGEMVGPYHPSFGEMVRTKVAVKRMKQKLRQFPKGSKVEIFSDPASLSILIGQKKMGRMELESFMATRISFYPTNDKKCVVINGVSYALGDE